MRFRDKWLSLWFILLYIIDLEANSFFITIKGADMNEEIYKNTLHAGSRTYFFDVKKASTGILYLDINESKKKSDGTFERHSVMVFPEDIKHFKNEIVEIYEKFFANQGMVERSGSH